MGHLAQDARGQLGQLPVVHLACACALVDQVRSVAFTPWAIIDFAYSFIRSFMVSAWSSSFLSLVASKSRLKCGGIVSSPSSNVMMCTSVGFLVVVTHALVLALLVVLVHCVLLQQKRPTRTSSSVPSEVL